jgi:hypothetical protein
MSELLWRTPAEALAEHASQRLLLMFPTRAILTQIAQFKDIHALFAFAHGPRKIEPFTPALPQSAQGAIRT